MKQGFIIPVRCSGRRVMKASLRPLLIAMKLVAGSLTLPAHLPAADAEKLAMSELAQHQFEARAQAETERWVLERQYFETQRPVMWEFVQIPGGEFDPDSDEHDSETPVRRVHVSEFQMYKSEVTQEHWVAVMGTNPSIFPGCAECPVENVTWDEVQEFIRKESAQTGQSLRLPSGVEWEYAAGGGAARQKYAGTSTDNELGEYAWYGANAGGRTHAVCEKQPNQFGLCDMSGNVGEWVSDVYGNDAAGGGDNSTASAAVSRRANRGGSWSSGADNVRVAARAPADAGNRHGNIGFRLVRELPVLETPAQRDARLEAERTRGETVRRDLEAQAAEEASAPAAAPAEREADAQIKMEQARRLLGIEFVRIPGGEFAMGSNDGFADEKPVRRVRVNAFSIGKSEVTQAQWIAVMGSNPSQFKDCSDCPVQRVSWDDVQEFIRKASGQTGLSLRLPTEAEWEYAAGGGTMHQRWAGTGNEGELGDYAWYSPNSGYRTQPVCRKRTNRFGLCDMSGNVNEWVADSYWNYMGGSSDNPTGPSSGTQRVFRGGGWGVDADIARVTNRQCIPPDRSRVDLGFRLVLGQ